MPNWTKNELVIYNNDQTKISTKEILKKICTYNEEDKSYELDFNKIIPMPKNIFQGNLGEKERKKYGKNNWYDWSRENWGTKWNANTEYIEHCDEQIFVEFTTAWNPVEPIVEQLREMFENYDIDISGSYTGEGYEFAGVY